VNDHCKGLSSGIVDQSNGVGPDNVVLWHWNLGNGTELSQQNVNYTYPAAGNYPIELYVQSAGGCGAYHYDTVQVFETPQADFNFIGHCQGQEVLFSEGAISGGAAISSYSWNFDMPWMGAYNTSTINIPNRIFDQVGTYDVVLQVTDGNGCQDAVTLPVVIDPTPIANFVFESTCQGSPIQFLNTSVTQASSTYLWGFGDNTSSILVNPAKTYPDYGSVPVQLSVTNLSGCTDTVLQNVQVYAFPLPSLQIGPACMDSYTSFENTSNVPLGAIDSTIWILNQTDTIYGTDAAWMVNAMGQQQVEMMTWSDQGCMSQTSQFFDVNEQFNASFSIGTGIVATGQPFVFENTTNTSSVSLWNFGDGGFSTDFSPVHTFDAAYADSTLTVLLIALSPSGCVDSTTQEILIQRARIDLEITNLFLQKENAWYIMGVKLKNKGTVNLESAQLVVETTKGLLFNETWNGSLKPTEDSIYVFSAMPTNIFTDQDLIESYICVSGLGFDLYGNAESYLENNNVCRNVEGEGIVLLPVYPNPVYEDFTARIYVTNAAEVTFALTDDRGRTIENFIIAQTIGAGYYDYTVNTDQLSPGVYFLKVRSNGATQSSKFIFIRN
jgi:PKD repeat protein